MLLPHRKNALKIQLTIEKFIFFQITVIKKLSFIDYPFAAKINNFMSLASHSGIFEFTQSYHTTNHITKLNFWLKISEAYITGTSKFSFCAMEQEGISNPAKTYDKEI